MAKVLRTGPYEVKVLEACNVVVTEDSLNVDLNDGRTVSVPLAMVSTILSCLFNGER